MAAAKDECSRLVERVEQGESLRAGRRGDGRREQEKCRKENERDDASSRGDWKIQMPGNRRRGFAPAEPKARACARRNRGDLPERSGEKDNDRNRSKRNAGAGAIGCEGLRHAPDGLCDDRDRDELEAVQETLGNRSRECGCAHREGEQDQGRGRGEGEPRRKATQKAIAAENAEGKADLAGGRSRKKLTERDQVSIRHLVEPFAPHHQLVPKVSQMGDGAAERGQAQLQEYPKDFTRPALGSVTAHRRAPAIGLSPSSLRR